MLPALIVSSEKSRLLDFYKAEGSVVFKKLDGMGGDSVFRVTQDDPNANVIIETLTQKGAEPIMAQKFLPEIADGDKRILCLMANRFLTHWQGYPLRVKPEET